MLFMRAIISRVTCFITFNFTVVLNIGKIVSVLLRKILRIRSVTCKMSYNGSVA